MNVKKGAGFTVQISDGLGVYVCSMPLYLNIIEYNPNEFPLKITGWYDYSTLYGDDYVNETFNKTINSFTPKTLLTIEVKDSECIEFSVTITSKSGYKVTINNLSVISFKSLLHYFKRGLYA